MYDKHADKRTEPGTPNPGPFDPTGGQGRQWGADHRTLFSDSFKEALDGIGFSFLRKETQLTSLVFRLYAGLPIQMTTGGRHERENRQWFRSRVSFIGHDLHGITRGPDGRLYFSVGDRGFTSWTRMARFTRHPAEVRFSVVTPTGRISRSMPMVCAIRRTCFRQPGQPFYLRQHGRHRGQSPRSLRAR